MPSDPSRINPTVRFNNVKRSAHLSLLVYIFNVNNLSSNKHHVVNPVVLHGVVVLGADPVISDVSADALVNSSHIPGQSVDNPEVGPLVEDSGGHVAHWSLQLEVLSEGSGLQHVVNFRAGLLPVAEVTHGVRPGEGLEAESVSLLSYQNLISDGQRPLRAPDWPQGVRVLVRAPQDLAGGQLDLVIVAAVRDAAHPLAGAAGRVVLLLVTPPSPVPAVRVPVSLALHLHLAHHQHQEHVLQHHGRTLY